MSRTEDKWHRPRVVNVVVDNDSWIVPYAHRLVHIINSDGDKATFFDSYQDVECGAVTFFIGCVGIAPRTVLANSVYNLVVHESDLPKGRGFSPLTWQILDGQSEVPICLIEAAEKLDSGDIYFKDVLRFEGHELCAEIRKAQGEMTVDLCLRFMRSQLPPKPEQQTGRSSIYSRRRPRDSELDVHKTLAEQFNALRVVDNARYPAFFNHKGYRYEIKICKIDLAEDEN